MKKLSPEQKKLLKNATIIVLIVLVIAALVWFILSINRFSKAGDLRPDYRPRMDAQTDRPLVIQDIQPWMTFNYLNVVFKLPSVYLQNVLGITDTQYPNLRIDTYVRRQHADEAFVLRVLKTAITNYPLTAH